MYQLVCLAVLMLHIILCYVPVVEKMTAVDEILRVVRGCITHTGNASPHLLI